MSTDKKYIDYKKHIGMHVEIEAPFYSSFPIKGELLAVYSNILCIQGITIWGILSSHIVDFEVFQPSLFQEKGGNSVTPPECVMGNTSNGITKELVG